MIFSASRSHACERVLHLLRTIKTTILVEADKGCFTGRRRYSPHSRRSSSWTYILDPLSAGPDPIRARAPFPRATWSAFCRAGQEIPPLQSSSAAEKRESICAGSEISRSAAPRGVSDGNKRTRGMAMSCSDANHIQRRSSFSRQRQTTRAADRCAGVPVFTPSVEMSPNCGSEGHPGAANFRRSVGAYPQECILRAARRRTSTRRELTHGLVVYRACGAHRLAGSAARLDGHRSHTTVDPPGSRNARESKS